MKRFISLVSGLLLTSCAYALEGSLQEITFETPGAENAICYLNEESVKRTIRPPQAVTVTKSHNDLVVECLAPGNRKQSAVVEPETIDAIMLNVGAGLVPGLATDYATGAMFRYPEIVQIDFRGIRTKPMPMPAYHSSDVPPPMTSGLEEFRPSHPSLSDDSRIPHVLRRTGDPGAEAYNTSEDETNGSEDKKDAGGTEVQEKNFSEVTEDLTGKYNADVLSGTYRNPSSNSSAPVDYDERPAKSYSIMPMPAENSPVQLYPLK
jgi:hypothetical protein